MILYFDSYITDIALPGRSRHLLKEDIRKYTRSYAMPKKIDIAKYSLASYALYPWSYVLIKYELDDPKEYKQFDRYITSLFPDAHIIHTRSATQKEYKKSIKILEKLSDKWIFYTPNNDQPLISSDSNIASYINSLIRVANTWRKKYQYVSIMYSHYSEFLNIPVKGNPDNFLHGKGTVILEDNDIARVYVMPKGEFSSVQIVHIDHLKEWFCSVDMGNKRVIRAEDVRHNAIITNQVIIAPKKEICAHFDRYEHMIGLPNEIQNDQIPPLLIPEGFFTNTIKITYGYASYRKGWLNINPCAKKYSFRDNTKGTDLKITLEELPLFWRNHIAKIDSNKKNEPSQLEKCARKTNLIAQNPWRVTNQGMSIRTLKYWTKYFSFRFIIILRITASHLGIKKLLKA